MYSLLIALKNHITVVSVHLRVRPKFCCQIINIASKDPNILGW